MVDRISPTTIHHRAETFPGNLRQRFQEQGRAAAARRSGGLPAFAHRNPAGARSRSRPSGQKGDPQGG